MLQKWQKLNWEVVKLYEKGNISKAILIAEEALNLAKKIFPPINNNIAVNFITLAILYHEQGRCTEAGNLFEKSLEIREKLFIKSIIQRWENLNEEVVNLYKNIDIDTDIPITEKH
jgi:tetratricopeptide (TPR) repeat protein